MKNVDAVVGTKIITGCLVTPKGRAKAVMGGAVVGAVAGSAGRVATQSAVEQQNATASPLPPNAFSLGYLAVTETDLVLVRGQQGMMGPKAKDIVATVPRSEVAAAHMAG